MQKMETLSSLRIFKTILIILSLVLLFNIPTQAQGLLYKLRPIQHDLAASKIGEPATTKPYDYILKFLSSSSFPSRASFPSDFLFGTGSSALQIEGAGHEGGRGLGIWDDIVNQHKDVYGDVDKFPKKIEHYKRYKEDVQLLKRLGVNSYRMSISWSRVMPNGTLEGGINKEGINFYNNLINELLENGIEPFVTILHFDYPLALKQKFGGFLNHSIVKHYKDYSELLFKTYGDRVKYWTTINEVEVTSIFQYMLNIDNISTDEECKTTRKCTLSYTLLHNFLLAHASTSKLYRTKFQAIQGGEIGLVLSSGCYVPYSSKLEDVAATQRLMDFYWGWILDPVFHGNYPKIMRKLVGNRLPKFTKKEKKMLKGSTNFIGINYYTSHFAIYEPNRTKSIGDSYDALARSEVFNEEGKPLGYKDQYAWNYVYPEGLYNMLLYIKDKYKNPKVYITENGVASTKIPNPLKDEHRIAYIAAHINATKAAIDDGANVRGYFAWAAFDTFEFQAGYSGNWGLYHVDFNDNLKRIPTDAAKWYRKYLTHDLRD
ncbi:beta-glucosidase 13-like [Cicer arietinum]|uniref:Beta-glucosidase 13-like n=1 Tax=Cicer arietinum TaxID=3827 RepID=A0A1S2Z6U0_CICAR|nr:beta-glucosidase 13-like [Cicer arietinum]